MGDFDVYRLSEEHEVIREAVRAVCEGKVAPNAAAADETGEFPQASYDALRDGDGWVLDGAKRWITNAGVSEYYTVFAVTDPAAGARGISAFVVEKSDPGVGFGAPERKLGIKGSPTREVYFDGVRLPDERRI